MDKDEFKKSLGEEVKRWMSIRMENEAKAHFRNEFAKFDCATLSKMTNKDLAIWQSKHPIDSPQYLIALQEWNRRALVEQINVTKWSAIMGFLGVILGVLLTATFNWFLSPTHGDNPVQKQTIHQESTQNNSGNKAKITPPVR